MSVKHYEWMACDEHACHCDVVESAEGDMVDYEDYAALEARCAALAAENALLKKSEPAPFSKLMMEALDVYQAGADEVPELAMLSAYTKLRDGLKTPATDDFLAEVRAQALTNYADKRGFSFQHGSIHAHFGNGDVMVGAVTFENGDAGINFAPVRDKTGGIGTHYEWTRGKTAEQVDSVFVIASSNAEGLEVIRDKLSEAITQLRKGAAL